MTPKCHKMNYSPFLQSRILDEKDGKRKHRFSHCLAGVGVRLTHQAINTRQIRKCILTYFRRALVAAVLEERGGSSATASFKSIEISIQNPHIIFRPSANEYRGIKSNCLRNVFIKF